MLEMSTVYVPTLTNSFYRSSYHVIQLLMVYFRNCSPHPIFQITMIFKGRKLAVLNLVILPATSLAHWFPSIGQEKLHCGIVPHFRYCEEVPHFVGNTYYFWWPTVNSLSILRFNSGEMSKYPSKDPSKIIGPINLWLCPFIRWSHIILLIKDSIFLLNMLLFVKRISIRKFWINSHFLKKLVPICKSSDRIIFIQFLM